MIRKCLPGDIDDIVLLEDECFKSPLGREFIVRELNENPLSNYLCFEENGVIKGYIGLWLTDIGAILNLAVKEESRGSGIGSMLLNSAIDIFADNNIFEISLDVRESNIVAQNLYKKYNFKEVLIRKNYYENKEDAIVMIRSKL